MATVGGAGNGGSGSIIVAGGYLVQQQNAANAAAQAAAAAAAQQAAAAQTYVPPYIPVPQATEYALPILAPASYVPEIYPAFSFDVGGARDAMVSRLTGISNTADQYGKKAIILGKMQLYPKLGGTVVRYSEGAESHLKVLLHVALGTPTITNIKVGKRPISELTEIEYAIVTDLNFTKYTQDYEEAVVAEEFKISEAVTQRTPQPGNEFTVEFEAPDGLNGTATFLLEYRDPHAGVGEDYHDWATITTDALGDASTSSTPYSLTHHFDEAHPDEVRDWDLRITQQTGPKIVWQTFRTLKPGVPAKAVKDRYGNVVPETFIEMIATGSANLQSNIEQISLEAETVWKGWNGTAWEDGHSTTNPAVALAFVLVGPLSNSELSLSDLDGPSFGLMAEHCDTNGFTFNAVFDSEGTLLAAAESILSLCRCILIDVNGKIGVSIDRRKIEIEQVFTPVNSWGYSGEGPEVDLPDYVRVNYINAEADYKQDQKYVYADGKDDTNSARFETVYAFGCTNEDQAWKYGRLKLAEGRLRQDKHYIYTSLDWIRCRRGGLVLFSHNAISVGGQSARIRALLVDGSANIIGATLDDAVSMASGTRYGIRIRTADGQYITREVNNVPGETYQVTFTIVIPPDAAALPAADDLILFGELNREGEEMIVQEIEPSDENEARLTLVPHAAAMWDSISGELPAPQNPVQITPIQQEVIPAPVVVRVQSNEDVLLRFSDNSLQSRIVVTLGVKPGNVRYYETDYRPLGATSWTAIPTAAGPQIVIYPVVDSVIYEVRIRSISNLFYPSEYTTFEHTVIGQTTPPPDVDSLDASGPQGNTLLITADPPIDFAGYKLVWNYGINTNRSVAQVASALHTTAQFDMSSLPADTISIGVVMVDMAGNESVNMRWFVRNSGDPLVGTLYYTESDAPTFPGTIEGGFVDVDGVLKANEDASALWGADDNAPLWDPDPLVQMWRGNFTKLIYTRRWRPPSDIYETSQITLDLEGLSGEGLLVEYRRFGKEPLWDNTPGGDTRRWWNGGTAPLWIADPPFVPWPGSIPGRQEEIEIRITCQASTRWQGKIPKVDFRVSLPTKTERINNFLVDSASGKRLQLANTYRVITAVRPTVNYSSAYPTALYALPLDKLPEGPLVQVFSAAGSGTIGIIDADVEGY